MNIRKIFTNLFFKIIVFNSRNKCHLQANLGIYSRTLFCSLALGVFWVFPLAVGFSVFPAQAQQASSSLESLQNEREKLAEKVKRVEAMLQELKAEQAKFEERLDRGEAKQEKFAEQLEKKKANQEKFAEQLEKKKADIAFLKEEQKKQKQEWTTAFDNISRDPRNRLQGTGSDDGWIDLPGYNTAIRFGGFIQLDAIHDFQQSGSNFGAFSASKIPVPTDRDSNTEFDPRTTRMIFETRTDTALGKYSTFLSADWFGSSDNSDGPKVRLRQAYVTGVGLIPGTAFTFGQANSTFMDNKAWPEVLDNAGPASYVFVQQGLFRLSTELDEAKRWIASLAVEQPDNKVSNGNGKSEWPDAVGRVDFNDNWGHLMGAMVARQVKAEATSGTVIDSASAFGWGLNLSGMLMVPDTKDNFKFQFNGGEGIGRYIVSGGADATYNIATQDMDLSRVYGAYGAYQHWWTNTLRSTLMGSHARFFNRSIESFSALKSVLHTSANLIYSPLKPLDVGIEYTWGQRENKDGQKGHANRLMFSAKWSIN